MSKEVCWSPKWWTSQSMELSTEICRQKNVEKLSCCPTPANPPCVPCTRSGPNTRKSLQALHMTQGSLKTPVQTWFSSQDTLMYLFPPFLPNPWGSLTLALFSELKTICFLKGLPHGKGNFSVLGEAPNPLAQTCLIYSSQRCWCLDLFCS